ncbi:hypothetical protein BD310DRAFT_918437 [Dichomitus squalens]|uniref:Uncharacterized protein n=1 Tax=Dichomitus squalens TaxID=114155 RepID=A0A4Q9Q4Z4_9APHY|nr:hypothetical protein BD310DRAFT_918437 [Dichomitus squalens]
MLHLLRPSGGAWGRTAVSSGEGLLNRRLDASPSGAVRNLSSHCHRMGWEGALPFWSLHHHKEALSPFQSLTARQSMGEKLVAIRGRC